MRARTNRKRYAALSSLKDLRMERRRLNWEIDVVEDSLRREYYDFRSMFSVENLVSMVLNKVSAFSGAAKYIFSGFSVAKSIFGAVKNLRKTKRVKQAREPRARVAESMVKSSVAATPRKVTTVTVKSKTKPSGKKVVTEKKTVTKAAKE